MKRFGVVLILLLAIVAAGGYYLFANIAPLVKSQVEAKGSAATGTAVTVGSVTFSFQHGTAVLNDLKIANPTGYAAGEALSAGKVSATVNLASVFGKGPLIIRELVIRAPSLSYEGNGFESNLSKIQDHVAGYAKSMQDAAPTDAQPGTGNTERKMIIRDLYVRDGKVSITHKELKEPLVAELGEIHVRNIGEMSGGASYAEITKSVLGAVMGAAARVAVENLVVKTGPVGAAVNGINNLLGGGKSN